MDKTNTVAVTPSAAVQNKILDAIHEMVCAIDTKGHFVYVNAASLSILGYRPQELIGVSCFDLVVEEDRQISMQANKDSYLGANIPVFENRYRHKDGRIISMHWEGGWDFGDNLLYTAGRDITEQRNIERLQLEQYAELRATQKELGQLLERVTDGFIGIDRMMRITYWNKAAEVISGLPAKKMIGHVLWDVLPEPTLSVARKHYETIVQSTVPVQMEFFSKRINRWVEVISYPSESGQSVFFRDITERKDLQEQLILQKEQHQKKIASAVLKATENERSEVSKELHDNINQVLTTVKLYNELCLSNVELRDELLKKSMELLQNSINDIRGLSKRLSAPSIGNIALSDSVRELTDSIQATNRFKINVAQRLSGLVVGNEIHIAVYRILQEHFTNIIKHAQASAVNVDMYVQRDMLTVQVADDGVGIDPAKTPTGIGISNMKNRAEEIGGSLEISGTLHAGCTLLLKVPLA